MLLNSSLLLLLFKQPTSPTSIKPFRDIPNHHNRYLIPKAIRRAAKLANMQTNSPINIATKTKTLTVTTIRTKLCTSPTTTSMTKTTKVSLFHCRGIIIKVLQTMVATLITSRKTSRKTITPMDSTARHNNFTSLKLHISLYRKFNRILCSCRYKRLTAKHISLYRH